MNHITTRKELDNVSPYPVGLSINELQKRYNLPKVRKMSDNESVYGPSPAVKKAILQESNSLYLYPDGSASKVRQSLSNLYQINAGNIIVSNGSEEILRLLTRAYLNKDEEAIMAEITFPRYESNVLLEGGNPIKVPLIAGVHNLQGMYDSITERTKMIFVCNPNNPTGTVVDGEDLLAFIKKVPSTILLVIDEAYYEYVNSNQYLQTIPLLRKHPNIIILRTFSKIYGLASLRIGYGIMAAEIVQQLDKVRDVFNVNHFAQEAAVSALCDQAFIQDCSRKTREEIDYVTQNLVELGFNCFPSATNFIFVYSQYQITSKLTEHGFLVRSMKLPGYQDAFRITVGNREDNEAFLHTVRTLIGEKVL